MTSLSEVYRGKQAETSLQRLLFGLGLFLAGALLVVSGIVVATTDVLYGADPAALTAKRQLGGVLAGVGVPAVFLGIFAVLPSARLTKAAAVVGAGIAVIGVALFTYAYPCRWSGSLCGTGKPDLTLLTVGVYFLGAIITFWCLFAGVANFKTRNDPGGTATVNVTRKRETQYVPVERSRGGLGGIGFFGSTPDGDVETQTAGTSGTGASGRAGSTPGPASDGGTDADTISSPLDEPSGRPSRSPDGAAAGRRNRSASRAQGPQSPRDDGTATASGPGTPGTTPGDTYCGNCAHFEYVRTDSGIQPYCGAHDELMEEMDPCEEWTPRSDRHR
ncbi:ribonuclease BN [Halobellus sp. Atlit-31R]|nr:ribonuclease BN [Halobellus sp. Atlit-31R]